jgi:hypothetical protein
MWKRVPWLGERFVGHRKEMRRLERNSILGLHQRESAEEWILEAGGQMM